jgi:hypothetical protein
MSTTTAKRDVRLHVLIVAGRPDWYGPRWECLRKARGYSLATTPFVKSAIKS